MNDPNSSGTWGETGWAIPVGEIIQVWTNRGDRAKDMGGSLKGKIVFSGKPSGSRTDKSWLQDERDVYGQIWWWYPSPIRCYRTRTKAAMSSTRLSMVLEVEGTSCTMWHLFRNHDPLRYPHSSFQRVQEASHSCHFSFTTQRCSIISLTQH